MLDLIIRNARLRDKKQLIDIGISNGRITTLGEIKEGGKREIDVEGKLVTPAFVQPHAHLSTSFLLRNTRPNISGTRTEAVEISRQSDLSLDLEKRIEDAISVFVIHGVTRLRDHVSVFSTDQLRMLKTMLELKEKWKDILDIQIVALPGEPIRFCEEPLRKAMELGAEVVGGVPNVEITDEETRRFIDKIFEIAVEYKAMIDLHTDENDDPSSRALEYLASKTIKEEYHGKVTASHACALASYDESHASFVINAVKRAGINVVTNPETNLVLEGRFDTYPKRRGLTRVKEFLREGVNVACGHDDVMNPFTPFGRGDPLEVGLVLGLAAHMTSPQEIETIFDMLTINSAKVLGVDQDYGVEEGKRADLVVIDASSAYEAIRTNADRRYTIKEGTIVAEAYSSKKIYHIN